jgi:hypothetical protein
VYERDREKVLSRQKASKEANRDRYLSSKRASHHRTKEARKAARREYCSRTKEQAKLRYKRWLERKREHFNAYQASYRKANLPTVRVWRRNTLANNPQLRMRRAFSGRISRELSLRGRKKQGRVFEFLGYSRDDLVRRLESLFQSGMSWDNYGKWHVDHIRPVSSFAFTGLDDPEFRRCWALENLQPLWAADNIRKSNKWAA